ncbi:alkylphosphocholine resistance protein lem3 [Batrachochytrium dendrobatidis]
MDTTPQTCLTYQNGERLHVWMRKAGLPHFRKLWGRNNTSTLDQGIWEVSIIGTAGVFEGTKSLVFGQIGLMGSKNLFLGYAFSIMGCICALFTVLIGVYRPRKMGDHAHLSWVKKQT